MILFDTIDELFAANSQPCYEEQIFSPSDLRFQLSLGLQLNEISYVTTVEIINPTTLAVEADISAYFNLGITDNYYTFILASFAPFMCDCTRFILKVSIPYFQLEYYLGIYKIHSCCSASYDVLLDGQHATPFSETSTSVRLKSPLKIESWNDCYDVFTGERFSDSYTKISCFEGRLIQEPRKIEKEMSLNCRVLSVKSFREYTVEVFSIIPAWKMDEVTLQMQHQYIYINGKPYIFNGDVVAKRNEETCENIYYFSFKVQDCEVKQRFGCTDVCVPQLTTVFYPVPPTGKIIYDENGRFMSSGTKEEFVDYMRGVAGTYSVTDLGDVLEVTTEGLVTSYYVGYVNQSTRVTGQPTEGGATPLIFCIKPVIGTILISPSTCATPVVGTITATLEVEEPPYVIVKEMDFVIKDDDMVSGTPETVNIIPELLNGDIIYIKKVGDILFTDFTFDNSTATLTFTDTTGLSVGDILHITYSTKTP